MHNKKNEIKVASDYWESLTVARDLEENGVDTLYGYYGENEEYRVAFSKLDNGMHLAICAPLYENEIANGNLQINLDYNSKDEVGVLARSFEETSPY